MTTVETAENRGVSAEELRALLGKSRAKKGIFEGDLNEGLLEIGQIVSLFHHSETVDEVMTDLIESYRKARSRLT